MPWSYESIYGNTHLVAEAIARSLRSAGPVQVVSVAAARFENVRCYDLVMAGGPTHARGMSRPETRQSAMTAATRQPDRLQLEPDAGGMGLRTWLDTLGPCDGNAAAFDTRLDAHPLLTGKASWASPQFCTTTGFGWSPSR